MYKLDAARVRTMRAKLGRASELIKNDQYLPMFRNRQINYPKEFEESVTQAMGKANPSHWLASIWAKSKIKATLTMLGKYLAKKVADAARQREANRIAKAKADAVANCTEKQRANNLRRLNELVAGSKLFMRI